MLFHWWCLKSEKHRVVLQIWTFTVCCCWLFVSFNFVTTFTVTVSWLGASQIGWCVMIWSALFLLLPLFFPEKINSFFGCHIFTNPLLVLSCHSSLFQITRDYTFLDYILGGCQLMFTVSMIKTHPFFSCLCNDAIMRYLFLQSFCPGKQMKNILLFYFSSPGGYSWIMIIYMQ